MPIFLLFIGYSLISKFQSCCFGLRVLMLAMFGYLIATGAAVFAVVVLLLQATFKDNEAQFPPKPSNWDNIS